MTPTPAFEKAVRCRNPTQGDAIGQITARINLAPTELAHV
jgi:hypothetical protein